MLEEVKEKYRSIKEICRGSAEIAELVDFITLSILALSFIFYSIWYKNFAEIHIRLPFLDFPIFIGEIILFICLVLMVVKWVLVKKRFTKIHVFWVIYLAFMLIKAFVGYSKFGPLAFRHAALFYYPLFALISYEAYRKKFININFLLPLFFIVAFGKVLRGQQTYYNFTYLILMLLCVIKTPSKIIKIVGLGIILLFFPWESLIGCCRTQLIGHLAGFLILFVLLLKIIRIKVVYKTSLVVIVLFIFSLGLIKYKDTGNIKSLITPGDLIASMEEWSTIVESRIDSYTERRVPIRIYQPNSEEFGARSDYYYVEEEDVLEVRGEETTDERLEDTSEARGEETTDERLEDTSEAKRERAVLVPEGEKIKTPDMIINYNTTIFRLFAWIDMFEQFKDKKPFLGFHFGKPFRSERLEVSDMATQIVTENGWISLHNSYLEMIYRSGVVGLGLISIIFILLFGMIKRFVKFKSLGGVFLISIIVYWLTTAFVYVTFELPYSAISFWWIFGWNLAHSHRLKAENVEKEKG